MINQEKNSGKKSFTKIFAIALAVLMLMSSAVYAETINEFGKRLMVPQQYSLEVPTDIEVKKAEDTDFVDGPIVVKKSSDTDFPVFDFKAMLDMGPVRNLFTKLMSGARVLIAGDAGLLSELDELPVRGGFTVTITYPSRLTLPEAIKAGDLFGFNPEASSIFKETGREITVDTNWSKLTINIEVKSPDGTKDFVTAKQLEDNLAAYLCNLTLTCEDVSPMYYTTYRIYGDVTGYTTLGADAEGNNPITTINYSSLQMEGGHNADGSLSATVSVSKRNNNSSSSGGVGSTTTKDEVNLVFDVDGRTDVIDAVVSENGKITVNIAKLPIPTKEGSQFAGWYLDKECTIPADDTVTFEKDAVLYAKFDNIVVPPVLTEEHLAYVIGYPEGDVRPENTITREEVASIFYRLLTKERREEILTDENNFSDVATERWSNKAISSMTEGGYLSGYEDGTFKPAKAISRAEFATIIANFGDGEEVNGYDFPDIAGHWAEKYIVAATKRGIINGYEDGTFRPDNAITRAEAMTMINRMLVRKVDADGILPDAKKWNDISTSDWYYYDVIEATNSHSYERRDDGILENWKEILPNQVLEEKDVFEDAEK